MVKCKACGEREAVTEYEGVPICRQCERMMDQDPMLDHDTWYQNDGLEGLAVLNVITDEDDAE